MTTQAAPSLEDLHAVVRSYGVLVKWALAAAVVGAVWVTAMTFRVAALEKAADKLGPMEKALTRIETRLGIAEDGK